MAARFIRRDDGQFLNKDHTLGILNQMLKMVEAEQLSAYQMQFTIDDNEDLKGLMVLNFGKLWDGFESIHSLNQDNGIETRVVDIEDEAEVWAEEDMFEEGNIEDYQNLSKFADSKMQTGEHAERQKRERLQRQANLKAEREAANEADRREAEDEANAKAKDQKEQERKDKEFEERKKQRAEEEKERQRLKKEAKEAKAKAQALAEAEAEAIASGDKNEKMRIKKERKEAEAEAARLKQEAKKLKEKENDDSVDNNEAKEKRKEEKKAEKKSKKEAKSKSGSSTQEATKGESTKGESKQKKPSKKESDKLAGSSTQEAKEESKQKKTSKKAKDSAKSSEVHKSETSNSTDISNATDNSNQFNENESSGSKFDLDEEQVVASSVDEVDAANDTLDAGVADTDVGADEDRANDGDDADSQEVAEDDANEGGDEAESVYSSSAFLSSDDTDLDLDTDKDLESDSESVAGSIASARRVKIGTVVVNQFITEPMNQSFKPTHIGDGVEDIKSDIESEGEDDIFGILRKMRNKTNRVMQRQSNLRKDLTGGRALSRSVHFADVEERVYRSQEEI